VSVVVLVSANLSCVSCLGSAMLGCLVVKGDDLDELLGSGRAVTRTFSMLKHRKYFELRDKQLENMGASGSFPDLVAGAADKEAPRAAVVAASPSQSNPDSPPPKQQSTRFSLISTLTNNNNSTTDMNRGQSPPSRQQSGLAGVEDPQSQRQQQLQNMLKSCGQITLRGCPGGGYELNIYSARRLELPGPERQPFAVVYWNNEEIGRLP
jgi:hypothetical protein